MGLKHVAARVFYKGVFDGCCLPIVLKEIGPHGGWGEGHGTAHNTVF
jgi:hypothetical protein